MPAEIVRFGPFRLDRAKRVLWREGELVSLPPKAVDLLVALVDDAGDVVAKEDLMERVWPETFVEEANLSVTMSILRRALGSQEGGQPYVQTVSRRGYRFLAAVADDAPHLPSLAVLPLRNLAPRPEDEHLGVGLADAMIMRLSRLGRVVVRPTSATLRHAGGDPREAGRALRVDAVLEGTVQREGGRVRLGVQLVDVATGAMRWGETFEEEATSLFAVQDAVAQRVADALSARLDGSGPPTPPRRPPAPAAHEAYIKGRYFWTRLTGPWVERAVGCFHQAADEDPSFAPPHAGLAEAFLVLGFSGVLPPADAWPLAEEEARRALALDDGLSEARVALAYVLLFRSWDWPAAGAELRRAVAANPHSAGPHQWAALFELMLGRRREAQRLIARAREIDPVSVVASTLAGFQAYLARDRETELEAYRATVELEPNHFLGHWGLALALEGQGRYDEAIEESREAVRLSPGMLLMKPVLARGLALAGRSDEARALLGELHAAEAPALSLYQRAAVQIALGESGAALASLEEAGRAHDPWLVWLRSDPMLAPIRSDPRFAALERRVFDRAPAPDVPEGA